MAKCMKTKANNVNKVWLNVSLVNCICLMACCSTGSWRLAVLSKKSTQKGKASKIWHNGIFLGYPSETPCKMTGWAFQGK